MSFAAPAFLALGAAMVLVVVALHLLARRRPRPRVFPTARFVPDRPARAPAMARRPTDLLLLVLRALAVALLATAFARPSVRPSGTVARLVLVDRSRAVRSAAEARDSATAALRAGGVLIAFDSSARVVDAVSDLEAAGSAARGSISTALIAALREAGRLARRADSVELAVVSPLVEEEWDAATGDVRAEWPGRIRVVRIAAAPAPETGVSLDATDDDPLGAAVSLAGLRVDAAPVRLVRAGATAADSAWARGGGALVVWPIAAPPSWPAGPAGTVGAVTAGDAPVVAPFVRAARPPPGTAVAHWVDGVPAATEVAVGDGCIRSVAVPIAGAGDLALREGTRRFVRALVAPCRGERRLAALPDSVVTRLEGDGGLAAAGALIRAEARVPASAVLLVAAFALLALEQIVRRRKTVSA